MKKILLTGGGSAGHVTPNLALLPELKACGYEAEYVGGAGIEKKLAEDAGLTYHEISAGKLRRDKLFSIKNFGDAFRTAAGVADAARIIGRVKPCCIFSKGGFVGLPVAVAGRLRGVPVILHESDLTSGLANRLSVPFASAVCVSFPETLDRLPKKKAILTGNPIRRELLMGDAAKGRALCGFSGLKPVLLAMGGSLGAQTVNDALRKALPLLGDFDVAHICGRGKLAPETRGIRGYACFEYLDKELADLLAAADIIVSRAGSNSINEFLALRKPSLLIPLANRATRGDQPQNAASFVKQGFAMSLEERLLTPETLAENIRGLYENRAAHIGRMEGSARNDAAGEVMKVIERFAR